MHELDVVDGAARHNRRREPLDDARRRRRHVVGRAAIEQRHDKLQYLCPPLVSRTRLLRLRRPASAFVDRVRRPRPARRAPATAQTRQTAPTCAGANRAWACTCERTAGHACLVTHQSKPSEKARHAAHCIASAPARLTISPPHAAIGASAAIDIADDDAAAAAAAAANDVAFSTSSPLGLFVNA